MVVNEAPAGLQSHASAKPAGANSNPIFISFFYPHKIIFCIARFLPVFCQTEAVSCIQFDRSLILFKDQQRVRRGISQQIFQKRLPDPLSLKRRFHKQLFE